MTGRMRLRRYPVALAPGLHLSQGFPDSSFVPPAARAWGDPVAAASC